MYIVDCHVSQVVWTLQNARGKTRVYTMAVRVELPRRVI